MTQLLKKTAYDLPIPSNDNLFAEIKGGEVWVTVTGDAPVRFESVLAAKHFIDAYYEYMYWFNR